MGEGMLIAGCQAALESKAIVTMNVTPMIQPASTQVFSL
jgi:hypothetical protein